MSGNVSGDLLHGVQAGDPRLRVRLSAPRQGLQGRRSRNSSDEPRCCSVCPALRTDVEPEAG